MSTPNYGPPVETYLAALRTEAASTATSAEQVTAIREELDAVKRATAPAPQPASAVQDPAPDAGR